MWFGHLIAGLVVAVPFGFDPVTILASLFFSWLPNFDAILVKLHFFKKDFHDGPTHSLIFSILVGLIVGISSLKYGLVAFLCCFLHCMCDIPTNTGISFFFPFKKGKVGVDLWKETGFWGLKSVIGYYKQKWAKILELLLVMIFIALYFLWPYYLKLPFPFIFR